MIGVALQVVQRWGWLLSLAWTVWNYPSTYADQRENLDFWSKVGGTVRDPHIWIPLLLTLCWAGSSVYLAVRSRTNAPFKVGNLSKIQKRMLCEIGDNSALSMKYQELIDTLGLPGGRQTVSDRKPLERAGLVVYEEQWVTLTDAGWDVVEQLQKSGECERLSEEIPTKMIDDRDILPELKSDPTEHDTDAIEAMSRLLNETHLRDVQPTVSAKELSLELFQAAVDGRIRLWMSRKEGQPLQLIPRDDLRHARVRTSESARSLEEEREIQNELSFSIIVVYSPYLGTWVNPKFSSQDLTAWFRWVDTDATMRSDSET